jgi:hypothetical protein
MKKTCNVQAYYVKGCKIDNKTISLMWNKSISGQFSLQWTKGEQILTKVITVESLF